MCSFMLNKKGFVGFFPFLVKKKINSLSKGDAGFISGPGILSLDKNHCSTDTAFQDREP